MFQFQDLFTKSTAQLASLTAPAKKLNALAVDNFEKLAQFQLENAKAYTDLSVEQLRAALDVNDAKSLQAFVSNQQKVAKTVGEKLTADAQTLAALGKQFATEVQKLAQENVATFANAAQAKKAAA